jgi:hypothetical protein
MQYEFIVPTCGCGDPSVPVTDTTTVLCKNSTTLDCVKNVTDNYDELGVSDRCDAYCPLECDSNIYTKSVSTARYYSGILGTQSSLQNKFTKGKSNSFSPPTNTFRRRREVNGWGVGPVTTTTTTQTAPLATTTVSASGGSVTTSSSGNATTASGGGSGGGGSLAPTLSKIQQSVLALSIYFDDLRYVSIEENPAMTVDTFVGVLGGMFG